MASLLRQRWRYDMAFLSQAWNDPLYVELLQLYHGVVPELGVKGYGDNCGLAQGEHHQVSLVDASHCHLALHLGVVAVLRFESVLLILLVTQLQTECWILEASVSHSVFPVFVGTLDL